MSGWPEWSHYVLKELERLDSCYEQLEIRVRKCENDIAVLKTQYKVWAGVVAFAVSVIWSVIFWHMKSK